MAAFALAMKSNQTFVVCIILIALILGLAKYFAVKVSNARAIFSVSEKEFGVEWIKDFGLWREPSLNFQFENLNEYVFEPWGEYSRLKVKTKDGTTAKFLFKENKRDIISFKTFLDQLQASILIFNNKDADITNDVKVGKTFLQGDVVIGIGILLVTIIILGWTKLLSGEQVNTTSGKMIFATIAVLFYLGIIIIARFSNKGKS